ncbi:MAG: isoleucine--tRNA ligase [Deltaproteobacteria bacterium]|jgi:isoleucyl-tRNA synthetase|nr:isoleucine--tRNA ligase [Deltaproteobacteria bacterium]
MDYKNTLNLPKTDFPMKASLAQREPAFLEKWRQMGLYERLQARGQGRPAWVLHDGPPYANGHIHMGTALNKILKDIIIKRKIMSGYASPYAPGWDCHGLPIEHQVEQNLGSKKKDLTRSEIRQLCRAHAEKFVDIQSKQFQRLGVLGDWAHPYLTMSYECEAIIARELGQTALDGRLHHSLKPVLWCGQCRTALAEAEVEYADVSSDSIYVAFPLISEPSPLAPQLSGQKVELLIWTTTPWTIPANLGVAFNPTLTYAAYNLDGRILIVAKALAANLWPKFGRGEGEEIAEINTTALLGLKARHPLYDRESLVVSAHYVTLEQGTGLVHTAPGHGREDYETGLAHNLPILSPLDNQARFTDEAPELAGLKVLEANPLVIQALSERGALLGSEKITHSYPHCWRCRKPVVFRATPQWFISMEEKNLRQESLRAINEVAWIPKWGRERIYGMIENRPDWCVSRQRTWGVPITIFFCQDCGRWLYTPAIQKRLFELIQAEGADAWFERPVEDLLPAGEKCACGSRNFRKETDILDVWFDSGSTFASVLEMRPELPNQADMYLEGSDQHRGWFHSSLLLSVANRRRAPYREVLTHGYVVDGQGRKMSKSIGNTIEPESLINKFGADIIRLWVAAENYQDDIRLSNAILDMLAKAYFNFRNTIRFILGNLYDFKKENARAYDQLDDLDRYALHHLGQLIERADKAYASYAFHDVYQLVNKFVGLLSSLYFDVVKDRLYTLGPRDPRRLGTQTVMSEILPALTLIMAPILSFTAEEIWSHLEPGEDNSVFLADAPKANPQWSRPELAAEFERLIAIRDRVNKALEEARRAKLIGSGLEAIGYLTAPAADYQILKKREDLLLEFFIISRLELTEGPELTVRIEVSPDPKCPRCWTRHPQTPADQSGVCPKCQKALADRDLVEPELTE